MADQGTWFKLWCAAPDDPDLAVLSIADFGRWAKFGAYTKKYGTNGTLIIQKPPEDVIHPLQAAFQVKRWHETIECISRFPNCKISTVSNETTGNVSWKIEWCNWWKYQGDLSTERVRRCRANKVVNETVQKRREKKRIYNPLNPPETEKNTEPPNTNESEVLAEMNRLTGKSWEPGKRYGETLRSRIKDGKSLDQLLAIVRWKVKEWQSNPEMRKYLTPETLFRPKHFDRYLVESQQSTLPDPSDPYAKFPQTWKCKECGEVHTVPAGAQRVCQRPVTEGIP